MLIRFIIQPVTRPDFDTSTGLQKTSLYFVITKKKTLWICKRRKKKKRKRKHSPSRLERREREMKKPAGTEKKRVKRSSDAPPKVRSLLSLLAKSIPNKTCSKVT